MGQVLSDLQYFSRRVHEEMARARRRSGRFSIAVFTSRPADGELPEMACVRGLPAILTGVRETDSVTRIDTDTIVVLLIDSMGEGSRRASIRLLHRLGTDASRWHVRVLEYPEHESILVEAGLDPAAA